MEGKFQCKEDLAAAIDDVLPFHDVEPKHIHFMPNYIIIQFIDKAPSPQQVYE